MKNFNRKKLSVLSKSAAIVCAMVLASVSLNAVAQAEVIQSSDFVVFPQQNPNDAAVDSRTITMTNIGDIDAVFGTGGFVGMGAGDFTVNPDIDMLGTSADNCDSTTLMPDTSCTVTVDFTAVGQGASNATYRWTIDGVNRDIWLTNTFNESSDNAAALRRIPPVVEFISIRNVGTGSLLGDGDMLSPGVEYTVSWIFATYDTAAAESLVALFDCDMDVTGCGDNFGDNFANSGAVTGTVLDSEDITSLGLPTYTFGGATAVHVTYEYNVTLPTGVDNGDTVALRFFQRGVEDITGANSGVSAMIPGGLDFLGQGDAAYVGEDGRRISAPVGPAAGP